MTLVFLSFFKNHLCLCVFLFFIVSEWHSETSLQQSPVIHISGPPLVTVNVLKMVDSLRVISWDFSHTTVRSASTKINNVVVVTDGQSCTKFTIYEEFSRKFQVGHTYIIRGYSVRGQQAPYLLNISSGTQFFRTTDIEVADDRYREAEALLHPPSTATHLSECASSQGLLTVEGHVVEASFCHGFQY